MIKINVNFLFFYYTLPAKILCQNHSLTPNTSPAKCRNSKIYHEPKYISAAMLKCKDKKKAIK